MKKTRLLTLFLFIWITLVVVPFIKGNEESYLDSLAKIAATGGLLGLFYQFMRERDLNEADFILRINQNFITNAQISRIYKMLEDSKVNNQEQNPFSPDDIIDMANYLSFFGPFYNLIEKKIVDIKSIDALLAYRFFLATNNRFVQDMLICIEQKEIAWQELYMLHGYWKSYREKNNREIWQTQYDLSKTIAYNKIIKSKL